jgi:SAM-dependent methyltransferase
MDKCPACFEMNSKSFLQLDKKRRKSFIEYSDTHYNGLLESWLVDIEPVLMLCGACGHIFYKKMPEESLLSQMYVSVKRANSAPAPCRPPSDKMVNEMLSLKKLIAKKRPTLLDYGAGYGRWSEAAYLAGLDVVSFEPHANRSRRNCKFDVVNDSVVLEKRKFDVIWLEQVLEHVPSPAAVLISIKKYMKKDSLLYVSVPNIYRCQEGSKIWEEWPFNGKSHHILAPYQHLHGFSQSSLDQLIFHSGFSNYFYKKLVSQKFVHMVRLFLGKSIRAVSTTKRYLKLK